MRPSAATAQGTLDKTPVAHLFVYVLERALTGTLDFLVDGNVVATLTTRSGVPTKIRTSDTEGLLGSILVDLGNVAAKQLTRALEDARSSGKLLGAVLVEQGAVTQEEIDRALQIQLERKLVRLFLLPATATFAYYDGFDGLETFGGAGSVIEPLAVLWAGVKQNPPFEHVTAALARVAGGRLGVPAHASPERLRLTRTEKEFVARLREEPQRLDALLALGVLPPSATQLLMYALLITKQIDVVPEAREEIPSSGMPSSHPASSHPVSSQPVSSSPTSSQRTSEVPAPDSSVSLDGAPGAAVARMRITKSVQRRAMIVEEEITISGSDRRGSPMPRRYLDASGAPIADAPKPPASVAPAPIAAAPIAAAPATVPPMSPRPNPASEAAPLSTRVPGMTNEHALLRKTIEDKFAAVEAESLFEVLGLAKGASAAEATGAYMKLVKQWHPDKVPAALADLKPKAATVFAKITEAHVTLTDGTKRKEYLEQLDKGVSKKDEEVAVQNALKAMNEFQKAEVFYRKKDLVNAETHARSAVELDGTQSDYIALLAWIEASRHEGNDTELLKRLLADVEKALTLNSESERALFYRGILHKRLGNEKAALRDFRYITDRNPKHVDAQREIRIYTMRKASGTPSTPPPSKRDGKSEPPGGFFGRLFKK